MWFHFLCMTVTCQPERDELAALLPDLQVRQEGWMHCIGE